MSFSDDVSSGADSRVILIFCVVANFSFFNYLSYSYTTFIWLLDNLQIRQLAVAVLADSQITDKSTRGLDSSRTSEIAVWSLDNSRIPPPDSSSDVTQLTHSPRFRLLRSFKMDLKDLSD